MKNNKKLFIGLLALSVFLGSCITFGSMPTKVKDIPPSWFEENRGEGERLVYVTLERVTELERGLAGGTQLFIVTDNAAIQGLTAPAKSVDAVGYLIDFSVQNSIQIYDRGLAVFSLPKSQDTIGFAYLCDAAVKTEALGAEGTIEGTISRITEVTYSNGHFTYKIDPEADDIAIRVLVRPNEAFRARTTGTMLIGAAPLRETRDDGTARLLTTTNNDAINQVVAGANQYGASSGTGTSGFIAAPAKE